MATAFQYIGNVFVVSRLGQLRNVQNFIKQFKAEKNILIIQYSEIDGPILKNMIEICDKELYNEIIYLKLPGHPLHVRRKKNIKMYNSIEKTLNYIIDKKYKFNNLFLCNADKWYSYYEKVKNEDGYSYTINLLEEGLTTYIVSEDPLYQTDPIIPINIKDIKKSLKEIINELKNLLHVLKVLIVKLIVFVLNLISIIFRTNLAKIIKDFILDLTIEDKYKFSYIKHFDEAFVCFPDKLIQNNFTIDNVKKLDFKFHEISKNKYVDALNRDYVLFVNQKYINYRQHFDIIFEILTKMNLKNVYIKLHPKEDKNLVIENINECLKKFPNLNVKVIHNLDSTPIEDIIYTCKFKKIIGITSSALLYCNEFIKNIKIISIAKEYRRMCLDKNYKVNKRELKLFEKEYRRFLKISNVKQYGGDVEENEMENKNKNKIKTKTLK